MFDPSQILNEILESRDDFMVDLAVSIIRQYEQERLNAIESLRLGDNESGDNFQEVYLFLVHLTSLVVASAALEIYSNYEDDMETCVEFLSDVYENTRNLIEQNINDDGSVMNEDNE